MPAQTSRRSVLVKIRRGAAGGRLALDGGRATVALEPLFGSIRPAGTAAALAAAPEWHLATPEGGLADAAPWDLCHALMRDGLGIAGAPVEAAEPDVEQQWIWDARPPGQGFSAAGCIAPDPPSPDLPAGNGPFWFRDGAHSELEAARAAVGDPPAADRVRIAHLDTGYDPTHTALPVRLRTDLARSFVPGDAPGDAIDDSTGLVNMRGHGTGTIGILAGGMAEGALLGGAPHMEIVPVRVASSVVLFWNSAIARALDYVHSLWDDPATRVHVVTMSMGGLASSAWADAVNALYEKGVFVVTAAGNNFANLPTREIVFPARFRRVVAACGVMADGRPYADLPPLTMAGNYGPPSKMKTAMAAFSPNIAWPRMGCPAIVDRNGAGTSSATPQIAAAAALWIQKHKSAWAAYPEGWMRVEAVRKALFDSAREGPGVDPERLGEGTLRAQKALDVPAADAAALTRQAEDDGSFPILRILFGLGAAGPDPRRAMLELEALQLSQRSAALAALVPDPAVPPATLSDADRRRIVAALVAAPGASKALREALGAAEIVDTPTFALPMPAPIPDPDRERRLIHAMSPDVPPPPARPLRVYAYDPLLGTSLETAEVNEATLPVRWERDLAPGPVGEYLEVVDVDPPSDAAYAPVDLNHPHLLSQDGLTPAEGVPQFHQQMVYAVAMKTIDHFERALGRVALWAPHFVPDAPPGEKEKFVRRLRIYPHALREANAYYSWDKKALLFGYFTASETAPGRNLPGGWVFTCLSHDIVAHETTHALLDGLHRRYREGTNPDVLAFHEAFADIVALFQHFTIPAALRHQIARTRGDLARQNLLGELAQQFGEAIGHYGALRSAIGGPGEKPGDWRPHEPTPEDYGRSEAPHDRGAVLVGAVFDAFLQIYRTRSAVLIRLATGGSGVLPAGDISPDLVDRLAAEASKSARHVLTMCIRALDYCPPVDVSFGDYLRALVTADLDLVADDPLGYRVAFVSGFQRRGIYPRSVRSLAVDSLAWERPAPGSGRLAGLPPMSGAWRLGSDRRKVFVESRRNAATLHRWLTDPSQERLLRAFGLERPGPFAVKVDGGDRPGRLTVPEVHAVRPARRIGPDGDMRSDFVVEVTQSWIPDDGPRERHRGGATLLLDLDSQELRYVVSKRVANAERIAAARGFAARAEAGLRRSYFDDDDRARREPFAIMHRHL